MTANLPAPIELKDISGDVRAFREDFQLFLEALDTEMAFMGQRFAIERILASRFVIIAVEGKHQIVGVYGTRQKFGMTAEFIIISKALQGKGLGKRMVTHCHLMMQGNPTRKLLLAVVDRRNIRSLSLFLSKGYRNVGRRWNLEYLLKPLNFRGTLLYYLVRTAFPFIRFLDRVRQHH